MGFQDGRVVTNSEKGSSGNCLLSMVVPCYNEAEVLPLFYSEAVRVSRDLERKWKLRTEFVFVDDGSIDDTLKVIQKLAEKDERVHYLSFSRNFGKESALLAGLKAAGGDYISTLDADLQDPPALLPEMMGYLLDKRSGNEFDCVATCRTTREGEPPIRSFFARLFYKVMNKLSDTQLVDGARDFRLMSRKFVDAVIQLTERNRFSKGIFSWVGFKTKWIPYENVERAAGKSKWSFFSLLKYSILGIISFSTVPLVLAAITGIICCLLAFLTFIGIVMRAAIYGDPVAGWPSMICAVLFIGGIQLFCLGIIGEYLANMYMEVKNRPVYLIQETNIER